MSLHIQLLDKNAPRQMHALMLVDKTDLNALVDFVDSTLSVNPDSNLFTSIMTHNHFMTQHQLIEDGEVQSDVYVINRRAFLLFVKASRFFVGNTRWKNAPVVKEMVLG